MPRHLTFSQIESALKRDKPVEQFLGSSGESAVGWLEIRPRGDGFELWRFAVLDQGDAEFLDLCSFSPVEEWPEKPLSAHLSLVDALQEAGTSCSAHPDRWVNQYMI